MSEQKVNYRVLMGKALTEIKELKRKLNKSKQRDSEPIAIIGASCRFPGGANSLDEYWNGLIQAKSGITTVPTHRWSAEDYYDQDQDAPGKMCSKVGGFLDEPITDFDASFFGISPREAESMDPQQRLLLELCWESLEESNILPETLFKSNTGVFMGVSSLDNVTRLMGEAPHENIDGYYGTGTALAPIAGRISYYFGFSGPSFVVDTACSSSLLSLHLACESLRARECDLALGGGVQLLSHPGISIAFTKAHMLSVDGQCKTFDADANGYVRGEGGGVVVLKRLDDAVRDGDEVLGLIRGSAVNQDGASGGLTVPSGPSQEAVIKRALEQAQLSASAVNYIEAHGTGTPLGDPIEMGALVSVFGEHRSNTDPLVVGSVKTNIGHLEASAGIASTIKVLLSLKHKKIAPHLNFNTPNPMIPWDAIPIEIPVEERKWDVVDSEVGRVAGISSFGFSGTNVHLIMSEYIPVPATDPQNFSEVKEHPVSALDMVPEETLVYQLMVISAKSEHSLRLLAAKHAKKIRDLAPADWPTYANSTIRYRTHLRYRMAITASNKKEALDTIDAFLDGEQPQNLSLGVYNEGDLSSTLALCTGQGSQFKGMGLSLYNSVPVFRETIDACNEIMEPILNESLTKILFDEQLDLDKTVFTQPALYALEVALANYWTYLGGKIDGVLGHSVGEYAAATIAGMLRLEDGAMMIAHRSTLMQACDQAGGMIAVFCSMETLEKAVDVTSRAGLSVAAMNGPSNLVLSGEREAIDALKLELDKQHIEFRELVVSHAFHSHLMEPMMEEYRSKIKDVRFSQPSIPIYNNRFGNNDYLVMMKVDYWVDHVRKPVLFEPSVSNALEDGFSQFVEIGPRPVLLNLAQKIVDLDREKTASPLVASIPLMTKSNQLSQQVLTGIGTHWCAGATIDWNHLAPGSCSLPTYAFDRKTYWKKIDYNTKGYSSQDSSSFGKSELVHPLLDRYFNSPLLKESFFESEFSLERVPFLEEHRVYDRLVVAGASHLSMIMEAVRLEHSSESFTLNNVVFPQALIIPEEESRKIQLMLSKDSSEELKNFRLISFEDSNEVLVHAIGEYGIGKKEPEAFDWETLSEQCKTPITAKAIYNNLAERKIVVGESYKWIESVYRDKRQAIAIFKAPKEAKSQGFGVHPGCLDACFGVVMNLTDVPAGETFIPFGFESLTQFRGIPDEPLHVLVNVKSETDVERKIVGDIFIQTQNGDPILTILGFEGKKATKEALLPQIKESKALIFEPRWQLTHDNVDHLIENSPAKKWLFVSQDGVYSRQCAKEWTALGMEVDYLELNHLVGNAQAEDKKDTIEPTLDWKGRDRDRFKHIEGILYFPSLNSEDHNGQYVLDQQKQILWPLLELIQGMVHNGYEWPIICITEGSISTSEQDPLISPGQASLRGFLRTVKQEYNHIITGLVDLSPDSVLTGKQLLAAVNNILLGEGDIAIRKGQFWAERMLEIPATSSADNLVYTDSQTIVLTGGLGSLAFILAHWLMDRGARSFVLIGRREPNSDQEKQINELKERGAKIAVVLSDLSDEHQLKSALAEQIEVFDTITDVFHLAGSLTDHLIETSTVDTLLEPFYAKGLGTHVLTKVFDALDLDRMIYFSSIASVLGSVGQVNYASANSFMDAHAAYQQAKGKKTMSINWGPWKTSGMISQLSEKERQRIEEKGFELLRNEHALELLEKSLLSTRSHQVGIAGFNSELVNTMPPSMQSLITPESPIHSEKVIETKFISALKKAKKEQRPQLMNQQLKRILYSSLKLRPDTDIDSRERLFDLGVDSLIALELKNTLQKELQVPISSTLLFDYPTLEALVTYLLNDLLSDVFDSVDRVTGVVEEGNSMGSDEGSDEGFDTDEESDEAALLRALDNLEGMNLS